jgi:hypothetical protein
MAQHIASYGNHSKDEFSWEWGRELSDKDKQVRDLYEAGGHKRHAN